MGRKLKNPNPLSLNLRIPEELQEIAEQESQAFVTEMKNIGVNATKTAYFNSIIVKHLNERKNQNARNERNNSN